MTYFAFLAVFVGIPLAVLSLITIRDYRRGNWQPRTLLSWTPWKVILGLCVVALAYTTPWDNYLVATGVWYYNPQLVTGIVFGWVPLEEYTFFVVLPVLTGLWTLLLMRTMPINPIKARWATGKGVRLGCTLALFIVWLTSVMIFILTFTDAAWKEFTYLSLTLSWALIPIMIQSFFGADILLRHWKIVLTAITTSTLYLGAADAIAINAGTWAIDPAQSLPVLVGGLMPIEEIVFFLIVNILVVMGLTLVLAEESHQRIYELEEISILQPLAKRLQALLPPPLEHSQGENQ